MNIPTRIRPVLLAIAAAALPAPGWAFDSGSTGVDGALNPAVSTEIALPPGGVFNHTTINIPAGVTVTFRRNAANTPVVLLATGNVTIAGTINVSGGAAPAAGAAGGGALGDDGLPGIGGPGGYDGGRGGRPAAFGPGNWLGNRGGAGLGPGAGSGGPAYSGAVCGLGSWPGVFGGSGAGYGAAGGVLYPSSPIMQSCLGIAAGPVYGSHLILPLTGGSGGGGGGGGANFAGAGGGGGGGAILIASSTTVSITGSILARGGAGGATGGELAGGAGGGGSGGAIRIIATTLTGNGVLSAAGGAAGAPVSPSGHVFHAAEPGGAGRIRLEAETITRTEASNPIASIGTPGTPFVAGAPALRISSVAGVAAPATPTGHADITLPAATPNPVTVTFETTGVPVGNTVRLTVTPADGGLPVVAISPALAGSTANATASVTVNLPPGPSVLLAQTTYTVVAALGDALRQYAGGEPVERVSVSAAHGGASRVTLITASGREVPASPIALALLGH